MGAFWQLHRAVPLSSVQHLLWKESRHQCLLRVALWRDCIDASIYSTSSMILHSPQYPFILLLFASIQSSPVSHSATGHCARSCGEVGTWLSSECGAHEGVYYGRRACRSSYIPPTWQSDALGPFPGTQIASVRHVMQSVHRRDTVSLPYSCTNSTAPDLCSDALERVLQNTRNRGHVCLALCYALAMVINALE